MVTDADIDAARQAADAKRAEAEAKAAQARARRNFADAQRDRASRARDEVLRTVQQSPLPEQLAAQDAQRRAVSARQMANSKKASIATDRERLNRELAAEVARAEQAAQADADREARISSTSYIGQLKAEVTAAQEAARQAAERVTLLTRALNEARDARNQRADDVQRARLTIKTYP